MACKPGSAAARARAISRYDLGDRSISQPHDHHERELDLEQLRAFWTERAVQHGQDSAASWSDRTVIDLEIREILGQLADGQTVLDVGCANGYSTVAYAAQRRVAIRGVDLIPG